MGIQLGPLDSLVWVPTCEHSSQNGLKEDLLSSKSSENRLRVNFQIMKPTIPKNAMPPATDRPTIVDVLTPLSESSSLSADDVELADAEEGS